MLPAERKGWSTLRDGGSSRPAESVTLDEHDPQKAARRRTDVESFGVDALARLFIDGPPS
jgi:hypothetical protein